ncbi:MAG TPA: branched-chain amino acid ABC transporter permease [Candidatus Limnocylindrales bacterium]
MDAGILTYQALNGLTIGAMYALIALGYTMVYGIIELINFAHGDVFMVGTFVTLWLLTTLGVQGTINNPVLLVILLVVMFAFSMTIMGLVGVLIERFAYRPLRRAPRLAPLITAIGVSFILQNVIQATYSTAPFNTPQVIDPQAGVSFTMPTFNVGGFAVTSSNVFLPYVHVFIIVLAIAMIVALQVFVHRTRLGRAMRSTAIDRDAAQLMGVDINTTIALTFFIGSALAGAAGVAWCLNYGNTKFDIGFQAGLKSFTAAVLGGIGNTTGAALGGFLIAFVEVFSSQLGYARWSEAIVFSILILVLVFKPTGILGQQLAERA